MTRRKENHHIGMIMVASATLVSVWIVMLILAITIWYPWNPLPKLDIAVVGYPTVGESMSIQLDYCKTRDWMAHEVRFSLINEVTVVLPPSVFSLPLGCHVTTVTVPLPQHIVPTKYRAQFETLYVPWPWVEIPYVRQSDIFEMRGAS